MSVEERLEARHQALLSLVQCAWYLRERDNLIRGAVTADVSKAEIARILGMSRQQVSEIANRKPGGPQRTSEVEGAAQQPKDDR